MYAALKLLDQAIQMGHEELAHLAAGDVDRAEELAFGRDNVLNVALSEDSLAEPAAQSLDVLLDKLTELKDLQARIIDEATRLQQDIGAQIRRFGLEQKRHAGYGCAVRPVPRIKSRFISRSS